MLRTIIAVVVALQLDTFIRGVYVFLLDRRAHKILRQRLGDLHRQRAEAETEIPTRGPEDLGYR